MKPKRRSYCKISVLSIDYDCGSSRGSPIVLEVKMDAGLLEIEPTSRPTQIAVSIIHK
ncbi:MAG: hypothetical protein P8X83_01825 [Nitrosopumilaceae archaeon]